MWPGVICRIPKGAGSLTMVGQLEHQLVNLLGACFPAHGLSSKHAFHSHHSIFAVDEQLTAPTLETAHSALSWMSDRQRWRLRPAYKADTLGFFHLAFGFQTIQTNGCPLPSSFSRIFRIDCSNELKSSKWRLCSQCLTTNGKDIKVSLRTCTASKSSLYRAEKGGRTIQVSSS